MTKILSIICTIVLLVAAFAPMALATEQGGVFPDFVVEGDLSSKHLEYLKVDSSKVRLSSIKADYLLIEVFSMYCPICQREATAVNGLYEKSLKYEKMRMVGVATGNTPFEVNFFRDEYKVPFPLFHDEQFEVNKGLGEVGTPYFVLVKNGGPGKLETILIHEGAVEDMDVFWDEIISAAGLK